MAIRNAIQKAIGKVKENYGFYKAGKRAEHMEQKNARVQQNIKRLRDYGNDDMADRMEGEYKILKRKGVY